MATLAEGGFPNLANWAKRQDPDGSISDIINVMSRKKPEINDMPMIEGNLPTGHLVTQALALPSPSWRQLNTGVAATKTDTQQFVETIGMLEDESKVDVDLAKLNGNAAAYRASDDKLKKESFAQTYSTSIFYESAASNPERVHGLTPRYKGTSGYMASDYVLSAGTEAGTNCHSIWLITWAPRKIYIAYPKGSMAGLVVKDRGEQRVLDADSNAFWAYVTQFQWKFGVVVEDYRYAVRLQWDPDDITDSAKTLYLKMQDMLTTIEDVDENTRFYMDRVSKMKLDAQLASNDANYLTYMNLGGKKLPHFQEVPIRVTDSLVAETAIS